MKLVFDFDAKKCTACGACAIACMDQNDIDIDAGQQPYRRIAQRESETELVYLSAACLHCPDAPCIPACPKACLYHDEVTGLVEYDNTGCVGCHACQRACPYGAISFRPTGGERPGRRWRSAPAAWPRFSRGTPPPASGPAPPAP